jgi:hypothetical protein
MGGAALGVSWAAALLSLGTTWAVILHWRELAGRAWDHGFDAGVNSSLAAVRAALTEETDTDSGENNDRPARPGHGQAGPAGGAVGDER